ncbi:MAG: hypothetical protein VKI63_02505 [Cyanobium sp.]|nr:hypothetical protein [Cyanobium sp.]
MGRFSGLRRMAMDVLVPRRPNGQPAWGEMAIDFLPDAAFATMAGVTAPAGWKTALVGEDLALGLGASLVGRFGGELVGRKLMGLDPIQNAERLSQLRIAGSMGLSMGPALMGFRPITQRMIEEQTQQAEQQQQLLAEEESRHLKEASLGLALGGIGLASRGPWDTLGGLQPSSTL